GAVAARWSAVVFSAHSVAMAPLLNAAAAALFVSVAKASEAFDAFDAAPAKVTEHAASSHSHRMPREHLRFQHSLVAQTAAEAEELRTQEERVFEQGRHMRARKALYEKHLAECEGDAFCAKALRARQERVEQLVASGKAPPDMVEGKEEAPAQPQGESRMHWLRHTVSSVAGPALRLYRVLRMELVP
ncbi:unnamed protein product, partial [Effrenium voratum]